MRQAIALPPSATGIRVLKVGEATGNVQCIFTGVEGIEPPVLVLETSGLPLTDTPRKARLETGGLPLPDAPKMIFPTRVLSDAMRS